MQHEKRKQLPTHTLQEAVEDDSAKIKDEAGFFRGLIGNARCAGKSTTYPYDLTD